RNCSEEAARERANALRYAVRDLSFVWNARRLSVTLSAGIVMVGQGSHPSFSEALSLADAACFLAKEKGRNRIQVSHASDEDIARQHSDMDWADRLKDCIREDRIVLYGQRLMALQSGQDEGIACREVLSRLLDYDGTLV